MKNSIVIPNYAQLIENTFIALKELGGSGKNTEINDKVAQLMNLPDEVLDVPHLISSSMSEVNYRCAWARTLLKNHGAMQRFLQWRNVPHRPVFHGPQYTAVPSPHRLSLVPHPPDLPVRSR